MNTRRIMLQCEADGAVREQMRAAELVAKGILHWTADDPGCPDVMRLAALAEELGEVADGEEARVLTARTVESLIEHQRKARALLAEDGAR